MVDVNGGGAVSQGEQTQSSSAQVVSLSDIGAEEIVCGECEEAEKPIAMKAPMRPTAKDIADHDLTHCPPRTWCDHCIRGQSKDYPHTSVSGTMAESTVTRVNMDYAFIKADETVTSTEPQEIETARQSMTILVMHETECSSVWGYAV